MWKQVSASSVGRIKLQCIDGAVTLFLRCRLDDTVATLTANRMQLAMAESTNQSSQANNPLSKKLNKILDNRFDSDKVSKLNQMISIAL